MKLVTQTQNIDGLKIQLAAEFTNVPLELDVDTDPKKTTLVVDESCRLFSSNAAVWYIFCSTGHRQQNPQLDKWMEWETSLLNPEIQAFVNKAVHHIEKPLDHLEKALKNKFILGVSPKV